MSVRAFDMLVYQALLHHLQTISKSLPAPARLVRVENIVHPSLLQRFAAHVETLVTTGALHDRSDAREDECPAEVRTLLPRLAFHGTCDRNVAASIAEQGLVSPGEHDHSGRLGKSVPPLLVCPLTKQLMREPVTLLTNGGVYEREATPFFARSSRASRARTWGTGRPEQDPEQ